MIFIRQKLHQHSGTNFEFCIKAGVTREKTENSRYKECKSTFSIRSKLCKIKEEIRTVSKLNEQ